MTYRLSSSMPNESRAVIEKKEAKRKFIFVIEGEKTEKIYLQAVAQSIKEEVLIEVRILERIEVTHLNQFKITKTIQNYLKTHEQLSEEIKKKFFKMIEQYEEEELTESELLETIEEILGDDKDVLISEHNEQIIEQIRTLNEINSYEKDFDKICLILDRDYRSFKENQYDKVLEICEENGFMLGISNPNFEFYLLLHIDDAQSLNQDEIKRNRKVTRKKTFVENELKTKLKSYGENYQKNKFDAFFFINRYPFYKKNIEYYSDDNINLKNEIGSSVHHILNFLL